MRKRVISIMIAIGMVLMQMPINTFAEPVTTTGTGTAPSVSAYATKAQMMDGTFAPNESGEATNYGKLVFGKNSSGESQEWYILGKDTGVTGDNTIIFAASPMATSKQFNPSSYDITIADIGSEDNRYSLIDTYSYTDIDSPATVADTHYGISSLRAELKTMAADTNYFTAAEQNLMNVTTVTTKDVKNNSADYKTTDKLYALAADARRDTTIKAGSSNSTVLAMGSYWNSGWWFWSRSAEDDGQMLVAHPGFLYPNYQVVSAGATSVLAIRPASNLNLSSVLFASGATAASSGTVSGTITSGTVMTLRLDGSSKNIGAAIYNAESGIIAVRKGGTSQTVALVVQGNDGTDDWYYSKKIDASETISASDIKSALGLSSDIDLSGCKIWLETTDTDGMIYAVGATEILSITSVEITGIDTPVSNTVLDTEASCATTGVSSNTPSVTWTPNDSTAGYNTSYTASVILTAGTGYEFTDSTAATVNGNTATSVTKNGDGTLTVTYTFSATAKDKLTSITAPQPITVANGTAYDAMNLPATVGIVTEGNTVTNAPVTWNTTTPANGSYDPAVLTGQTVTLNGVVDCPDSIDDNGIMLTTTITITISSAGIVGAPTANPTAGTYTSNQSVTLTSFTEGAKIYYTTDGSEPTVTGTATQQYTAPVAVTGTKGQSITTTIKAIAVKDGMQNSPVQSFTYTVNLPMPKHTITAAAGANGSISPSGAVQVTEGESKAFTITAREGYEIDTLKVDNADVSVTSGYTFTNVTADHTIAVTFKQKVTSEPDTDEDSDTEDYEILEGANGNWILNSAGNLSVRGSGDFSRFVGVKVDGTLIDAENYTAKEGSTIIMLKADYLNTLSVGTHTLEIIWSDGSASTVFTVSRNTSEDKNASGGTNLPADTEKKDEVPKTGDNTPIVWLFIISVISGMGLSLTAKKGRKNPETLTK